MEIIRKKIKRKGKNYPQRWCIPPDNDREVYHDVTQYGNSILSVPKSLREAGLYHEKFKEAYFKLLKERYKERKDEFIKLIHIAFTKKLVLMCYCKEDSEECHADYAIEFLHSLVEEDEENIF